MKGSVTPVVATAVLVVFVALIVFMGFRYLGGSGQKASNSLTAKGDITTVKPGDFDSLKKDIENASKSRGGTAN